MSQRWVLVNDQPLLDYSTSKVNISTMENIALSESVTFIHVVDQAFSGRFNIQVQENVRYQHWLINISRERVDYDVNVDLKGTKAEMTFRGIMLGKKKAELYHNVRIRHQAHDTKTDMLVHGIADEESRLSFLGLMRVDEGAKNVEAHELLKHLLLSNKAEVNAKPELEIYSNEVACTHGASVGDLDPEALFYMQSRGLDEAESKTLLLRSFATQFLHELHHDALQAWVEGMITKNQKYQ